MRELCITTDLTSSEWAAWVQAVCAAVAIMVAAATVIWQSVQSRREAQRWRAERAAGAVAELHLLSLDLCMEAARAESVASDGASPTQILAAPEWRSDMLQRLAAIRPAELPLQAMRQLVVLRMLVLRMPTSARDARSYASGPSPLSKWVVQEAQNVNHILAEMVRKTWTAIGERPPALEPAADGGQPGG